VSGNLRNQIRRLMGMLERDHGCTVTMSAKGSHWKVSRPGRGTVTVSHSPSDQRAWRNILADLRRVLDVDVKGS